MDAHDQKQKSPGGDIPPGDFSGVDQKLENTLQLGEQVVGFFTDMIELARMEAALAVRSFSRVLMLWFLMMPILLLTWCSFSGMMAWLAYSYTLHVGTGLFVFFFQQLLLLSICRWLYVRYRQRMTLPYTRAHINRFMRGFENGADSASRAKK